MTIMELRMIVDNYSSKPTSTHTTISMVSIIVYNFPFYIAAGYQ